MDQPKYEFDDIDTMKRNPAIEAGGTRVGFPGGNGRRWMRIAAATSNNPLWKAHADSIRRQLKAFDLAKAPESEVRSFLAEKYARLLVRDWGEWYSKGVEIPYSPEAVTALLIEADDAYKIVNGMVWDDDNFRAEEVRAVLEEGKG